MERLYGCHRQPAAAHLLMQKRLVGAHGRVVLQAMDSRLWEATARCDLSPPTPALRLPEHEIVVLRFAFALEAAAAVRRRRLGSVGPAPLRTLTPLLSRPHLHHGAQEAP